MNKYGLMYGGCLRNYQQREE